MKCNNHEPVKIKGDGFRCFNCKALLKKYTEDYWKDFWLGLLIFYGLFSFIGFICFLAHDWGIGVLFNVVGLGIGLITGSIMACESEVEWRKIGK